MYLYFNIATKMPIFISSLRYHTNVQNFPKTFPKNDEADIIYHQQIWNQYLDNCKKNKPESLFPNIIRLPSCTSLFALEVDQLNGLIKLRVLWKVPTFAACSELNHFSVYIRIGTNSTRYTLFIHNLTQLLLLLQ